ncbi:hypothetical protein V6N13_016313 [Hibiscus sabdariffa]|uniref:Uncharacterized protein n=1 Tax=Hibiscus sabdariffa TaxID=183260 RepID=A0ABR2BH99_9ROSI
MVEVAVAVVPNGGEASSSKIDGCLIIDDDNISDIGQVLSVGLVSVDGGKVNGSLTGLMVEEFPPLQSPKVKDRGKDKGRGSRNKCEVLQGIDLEEKTRKPRLAALGVMTLLQEMKAKKNGES